MTLTELKEFTKILHNDISFEDFKSATEHANYDPNYLNEIWRRFCKNQIVFVVSHAIGKDIFEMIQRKIETQNILKQNKN